MTATHKSTPRKYTFLTPLIPEALIVIFTSVTDAVAVAPRVFAGYFTIQAALAGFLAVRARSWPAVIGFSAIGLVMAFIMIFGLSV
jgi:hypothetical protein